MITVAVRMGLKRVGPFAAHEGRRAAERKVNEEKYYEGSVVVVLVVVVVVVTVVIACEQKGPAGTCEAWSVVCFGAQHSKPAGERRS